MTVNVNVLQSNSLLHWTGNTNPAGGVSTPSGPHGRLTQLVDIAPEYVLPKPRLHKGQQDNHLKS
eukprot:CAMPEP_0196756732 /NCGR_PEP_ID=MMETSP1091-20130531/102043_1 /TAXON_ID=302021 /ORGANISM="Rhodomonas sp., Strain CCMP768" /LENGTH=64 /DNA_ID=CAMNT_0042105401 /DNA_START=65 /DNA_END=258 /DNA_ORIENTATION=-